MIFLGEGILRLFETILVVMNLPLFVQAINFVLFMAFVMLTIEQNVQHITSATFFCFMAFFTQTLTNFVTYRTAETFTEYSIGFGYVIYDNIWYKLPVHQQKMLRFIIQRAQRPLVLKGSALFPINMEIFAKVLTKFQQISHETKYTVKFVVLLYFSSFVHRSRIT